MSGAGSATGRNGEGPTLDSSYPIVEFSLPGDPKYVRVARLVAGDMGERAGFSVDELEDVRLAVDELCAILIRDDRAPLELRMQQRAGELVIEGTTSGAQAPLTPSALSELLLRALVDFYSFDSNEYETSVVVRKQARDIP